MASIVESELPMSVKRTTVVRALLATTLLAAAVLTPQVSEAKGKTATARTKTQEPWCAPEIEALPNSVCYLDGAEQKAWKKGADGKRTLVIFLHGAIAKNTTWSWNHERMILRVAKAHNVEVLFPQSPESDAGFVWPGTQKSQDAVEESLISQWMGAKRVLEQRDNKAFDEVFVMGFSSGAYFTSSLAMRGRMDVDGYAVFAGGQPMPAPPQPVVRRSAVFVGVCSDDPTTATHSRAFAGSLAAAGISRMVQERHVGHGLDHVHFGSALAYLRSMNRPRLTLLSTPSETSGS